AGRRAGRRAVDLEAGAVGRLAVAGLVHAPEGEAVAARARDGEGAGVGLLRPAVHAVVGGGHAAGGVGGAEADADRAAGVPAVGLGAGQAGRRAGRRAVDLEAGAVGRLAVAGLVDAPDRQAVPARARDGEGAGVGLLRPAVHRVVGGGHAAGGVGGGQRHADRAAGVPAVAARGGGQAGRGHRLDAVDLDGLAGG